MYGNQSMQKAVNTQMRFYVFMPLCFYVNLLLWFTLQN